jgi:hypothetical protein
LKGHILKSFGGFESENLSLQAKNTISTTLDVAPLQNLTYIDQQVFFLTIMMKTNLHYCLAFINFASIRLNCNLMYITLEKNPKSMTPYMIDFVVILDI